LRYYHSNKLFDTLLGRHVIHAKEEARKQREDRAVVLHDNDTKADAPTAMGVFTTAVCATEEEMLSILHPDYLTLGKFSHEPPPPTRSFSYSVDNMSYSDAPKHCL
jgi:hypothetical protein